MDNFKDRLNKLIDEEGITKYKLAKDLCTSKATILNWTKGNNEPKVTDIIRLCRYFDVSADYLLGLSDY